MGKKALISGSNGFIGRHLWDALVDRDIEPIALDRHDLYIEVPQLTEIIFHHKPNYIIHLASYGNHRNQTDSTQTIMANFFATYNLLKATEFLEYEAFINVATSSMYGRQATAMNEEETQLRPDTFYAATKAAGYFLSRAFAKQFNKPIASVVPFSVYGEGEAPHRFIPQIIRHLVTSQEMTVNPSSTHDWIHVSDFVTGLLTVIDNIDKVQGDLVNIGTGVSMENLDVIAILEAISGKELSVKLVENPNPFDSPVWYADNAKLESFGWERKVTLGDGLEKCWKYYSQMSYDKN